MAGKRGKTPESVVREIRLKTPRKLTAEEKIHNVLEGLKGKANATDRRQS